METIADYQDYIRNQLTGDSVDPSTWVTIGLKVYELVQKRQSEKKEVTVEDIKFIPIERKQRLTLIGLLNSEFVRDLVKKIKQ